MLLLIAFRTDVVKKQGENQAVAVHPFKCCFAARFAHLTG
jgi:hypothetical protein